MSAFDQGRYHPILLLGGAVLDHGMRPEQIDVDGRACGDRTSGIADGLHEQGRVGDAEARPAIFLRHRDAEPAGLGHGLVERVREFGSAFLFQPPVVVEPVTDATDGVGDLAALVGDFDARRQFALLHVLLMSRCVLSNIPALWSLPGSGWPTMVLGKASRLRSWLRNVDAGFDAEAVAQQSDFLGGDIAGGRAVPGEGAAAQAADRSIEAGDAQAPDRPWRWRCRGRGCRADGGRLR